MAGRSLLTLGLLFFSTVAHGMPYGSYDEDLLSRLERVLGELDGSRSGSISYDEPASGQVEHIPIRNGILEEVESYDVDLEKDKYTMTVESGEGKGTKVVVDGVERTVSWYNAEDDICLLAEDVNKGIPTTETIMERLENDDVDRIVQNLVVYNRIESPDPENDRLILAEEIQGLCQGKFIYRLEEDIDVEVELVKKNSGKSKKFFPFVIPAIVGAVKIAKTASTAFKVARTVYKGYKAVNTINNLRKDNRCHGNTCVRRW